MPLECDGCGRPTGVSGAKVWLLTVAIFLPRYLCGGFTSNYGSSWLLVLSSREQTALYCHLTPAHKMGDKAEGLKTKPAPPPPPHQSITFCDKLTSISAGLRPDASSEEMRRWPGDSWGPAASDFRVGLALKSPPVVDKTTPDPPDN